MATRKVRWECPNGHPAVLGPTKPRKLATVRYCLMCSATASQLVERFAPALEKRREQQTEARKARVAKRQARAVEREAAYWRTRTGARCRSSRRRDQRASWQ